MTILWWGDPPCRQSRDRERSAQLNRSTLDKPYRLIPIVLVVA